MKDGIPAIYWALRHTWSAVHLLLIAALVVAALTWCLTDSNAVHAFHDLKVYTLDLQYRVSHALPFPWDRGWSA